MSDAPELSIIIPVFNEEGNIYPLYERITNTLKPLSLQYEVIMIDDGSNDASLSIMIELNKKDARIKLISFSRNFGHMIALSAGLDAAQGDSIITMDADLQHPPELIPFLLKKWREGNEVVNTLRKETKGVGVLKVFFSSLFYQLLNRIAKINLPSNSADYRLLDRKVVEALKQIHERSRFLRGLICWVGFKQDAVEYQADPRHTGKSKYSFGKMLSFAMDGITSFSAFPLRLSTYLGLVVAFLSFLNILYAVYIRFFTQRAMEGWASVLIALLFIGGVQLIFLGVIGEYLSRVYEETKQRPLYIINNKIGF